MHSDTPVTSAVTRRSAFPDATNLAATLELHYLHDTLVALSEKQPHAVDVGAHKGDVTETLTQFGFRVLAVEPQEALSIRLKTRFSHLIDLELVHVERCAASSYRGVAPMFMGSASTVNTLEESWTKVAFPSEFANSRRENVPLYTLRELMATAEFTKPAFVKIDVEGHELQALQGLFGGYPARTESPSIVMFEANQRFPQAARDCLKLLASNGYDRFDIFVREGIDPVAAERFTVDSSNVGLPAAWSAGGDKYVYANIIAYHASLPLAALPHDPVAYLHAYYIEAARAILQRALRIENERPISTHPIWSDARQKLRSYLTDEDWRGFLSHPVCKFMFFRGRWGNGQDQELALLQSGEFGRRLLATVRDPVVGNPRDSERIAGLSTNMLGMMYYLARLQATCALPQSIVEIGGGYGAFAWLYAKQNPSARYTIVDLPEMLAIQHYFLSIALPDRRVRLASRGDETPATGEILLMPASLVEAGTSPACELLFSTFGFSELPREMQQRIEQTNYCNASQIFLAGQLASEFPGIELVTHSEVVGAAMQRFSNLHVERFHTGDNYLLHGTRSAA